MAIPFLQHLDLNSKAELRNALLHLTTEASASNVEGKIIYDTSTDTIKYYAGASNPNGAGWVELDGSGDITRVNITAGAGLTGTVDTTSGEHTQTINVVGGDGITANADEIEVTVDGVTIELSATDGTGAVRAKTAAVANGGTALATGDQIFDFVDGSYLALADTLTFSGGDVTGSGAANSSINLTIGSDTVEASMLNDNVISGQTELASGLVSTDELLVSDAGVVKRMDVSVLEAYMQANLTFTNDTNTTYDLSVQAGGANDSVIRLTGSDATNDDVTISGTSTTVKVTESGNTITLDLQDDVTIANDLTVGGDINVTGSLNSYTTSELLVQDQYVTLNSGQSSPVLDAFLKVERGATDTAIKWNETTDRWQFTNDGSTYYNIPISSEYTAVTLTNSPGTYDYLTISGQAITLNQIDYNTDIANTPTIPTVNNATITLSPGNSGITMDVDNSFTLNQSGDETITISHADTSSQASVNNSGRTYIQDITLDDYGHVTGIASATETVTDTQLATAASLIDVSTMASASVATITHNLSSKNLIVQMYDTTSGLVVHADIDHASNNAIVITFALTGTQMVSAGIGDIRVVIIDAKNGLTDITPSYGV